VFRAKVVEENESQVLMFNIRFSESLMAFDTNEQTDVTAFF
jgi:hypothetical protein